uniref:Peptidase S1 domain-containing protein n=1 Tax=Strongyloides venezuelensis TaxID=75913 RepID=A0A0K0FKF5_STRVS
MANFDGLMISNDFDNQEKKKNKIILGLIIIIFLMIILFTIVFLIIFFNNSKGCREGLTQLRYKDTYELIQCHKNSTFDSCSFISENEKVECSEYEYEKLHVCCGSPQLLVQILTTSSISISQFNSLGKRTQDGNNKTNPLSSETLVDNIDINKNSGKYLAPYINQLINDGLNYLENKESVTPMTIEKLFDSKNFVNRINYPTNYGVEKNLFSQKEENFIKEIIEDTDLKLRNGEDDNNEMTNYITFEIESGPVLSIISSGIHYPGNITNMWHIETTVVLLKEKDCTVVVNTGMPIQKNDINNTLNSKTLYGDVFNYTVITSGIVHFIGNIELFPSHNLILETNLANQDSVMSILWYETSLYNLCSPNLSIIKTPGVTKNSVTVIAKNVPGMGTVAVGGSLFLSDENLFKIERNFIQNDTALLNSRKKIVCISDWIVPAYGNPVIVTKKMKYDMSC